MFSLKYSCSDDCVSRKDVQSYLGSEKIRYGIIENFFPINGELQLCHKLWIDYVRIRARPGIELGTTRIQDENNTT